MEMPSDVTKLAKDVIAALKVGNKTIATAECCIGGLIAGALTSISVSSDVVYGGFVTYANEAKIAMVGVPYGLLKQFGAVSKEVATAMAEGAMAAAGTHIAVAVTGIAGPNGGSKDKPVGLVHFAVATEDETRHHKMTFDPTWSRDQIRQASENETQKHDNKALAAV